MKRSVPFLLPFVLSFAAAGALAGCGPEVLNGAAPGGRGRQDLPGYGFNAGWLPLGGTTTSDPSLVATSDGRLHAFARGGDGALYWDALPSGATTWVGWTSLGGAITGTPSAVAMGGWVFVFVRGADNRLYERVYDGTSWIATHDPAGGAHDWLDLGGVLTADPVATLYRGNYRIDVFARGGDGALFHRWAYTFDPWDAAGWWDWERLGGAIHAQTGARPPYAAAANPGQRVDVIAADVGGGLFRTSWGGDGTAWTAWQLVGATAMQTPSIPSVVANGQGRIDVVTMAGDRHFYHASSTGSAWSAWDPLGGVGFAEPSLASVPVVASWGAGDLEVFAQGSDLALYRNQGGTGGDFQGWRKLTPDCYLRGSGAAVVARAANRIDVVVVGSDRAVYHDFYDYQPAVPGTAPPPCACGQPGNVCCGDGGCGAGLGCSGGTCQACGGANQACCGGSSCGASFTCSGGVCRCGGAGQPCCGGSSCGASLTCSGGVCRCGGAGQACCGGSSCGSGLACGGGVCKPCGATGQTCCPSGLNGGCPGNSNECRNGTCQPCGFPGQGCCGQGFCRYNDSACYPLQGAHGTCTSSCGRSGGACCAVQVNGQSTVWCATGYCTTYDGVSYFCP